MPDPSQDSARAGEGRLRLLELPRGTAATVLAVEAHGDDDTIARRLSALGFWPGEPIRVCARGVFGGEPLAVQVGGTRFALRRDEARRIWVRPQVAS